MIMLSSVHSERSKIKIFLTMMIIRFETYENLKFKHIFKLES